MMQMREKFPYLVSLQFCFIITSEVKDLKSTLIPLTEGQKIVTYHDSGQSLLNHDFGDRTRRFFSVLFWLGLFLYSVNNQSVYQKLVSMIGIAIPGITPNMYFQRQRNADTKFLNLIDQLKRRMSVLPSKHYEVEARIDKILNFRNFRNF